MTDAISILLAVQERLRRPSDRGAVGIVDRRSETVLRDKGFLQIKQYPPFNRLEGLHAVTADGFGQAATIALSNILVRLVQGDGPGKLLSQLEEETDRNSATYFFVAKLEGLQVNRRFDLGDDSWLAPLNEVSDNEYSRAAFSNSFGPFRMPASCCAVVCRIQVAPALLPSPAQGEQLTPPSSLGQQFKERTQEVVRALTIAFDERFQVTASYLVPEPFTLIGEAGQYISYSSPRAYSIVSTRLLEEAPFAEALRALRSFKPKGRLDLAIDRYQRAKLINARQERIVELGITAEMLFMHNEANTGEIRYKLSNRAGWFLGGTPESRIELAKLARSLYDARSQGLHKGRISEKTLEAFPIGEADTMVRNSLRQIAKAGSFPDWERLVFGASPQP